jgi:hypothetical protein
VVIDQKYNPITITLESEAEADIFISIIDQVDSLLGNINPHREITLSQRELIKDLSDKWSNLAGVRE